MTQEMLLMIIGVTVVALILGLLVGIMIGRRSPDSDSKKVQKELADYKAAVSEHFGKTADLVDNLTNSYRDVFEHLGSSAHQLLSEEDVQFHLQSRADKAVTLTYIVDKRTEVPESDSITAEPEDKNKKDIAHIEKNNLDNIGTLPKK